MFLDLMRSTWSRSCAKSRLQWTQRWSWGQLAIANAAGPSNHLRMTRLAAAGLPLPAIPGGIRQQNLALVTSSQPPGDAGAKLPGRRDQMAILRSGPPYFWVTWVTRLLSGEDSCEWSSWFRAHHEYGTWEQTPSSFDPVRWQMDHTAALSAARDIWEGQGYTAFTERQNCFALRGNRRRWAAGRTSSPGGTTRTSSST